MAANMIAIENITVRFGEKTVVQDVTATANSGNFIALVGPNGSGKSSLLKAIAGLIPHDGTTNLPIGRNQRATSLSYLAQTATAPERRSVKDIIALGRTPHIGALGRLSSADQDIIAGVIERCNLQGFETRLYGELSGGEQTRVHLARTLATQAPCLLADEPITALDPYYQLSILEILRETARQGTTVIAALHDLKLAERFSDQIWVMNSGQLVANNKSDQTLTPDLLRDVFRITADGNIAT